MSGQHIHKPVYGPGRTLVLYFPRHANGAQLEHFLRVFFTEGEDFWLLGPREEVQELGPTTAGQWALADRLLLAAPRGAQGPELWRACPRANAAGLPAFVMSLHELKSSKDLFEAWAAVNSTVIHEDGMSAVSMPTPVPGMVRFRAGKDLEAVKTFDKRQSPASVYTAPTASRRVEAAAAFAQWSGCVPLAPGDEAKQSRCMALPGLKVACMFRTSRLFSAVMRVSSGAGFPLVRADHPARAAVWDLDLLALTLDDAWKTQDGRLTGEQLRGVDSLLRELVRVKMQFDGRNFSSFAMDRSGAFRLMPEAFLHVKPCMSPDLFAMWAVQWRVPHSVLRCVSKFMGL